MEDPRDTATTALWLEIERLRAALVEIRDGLRADGRVWTLMPDGQSREEGPSLKAFIDEALKPKP